LIGLCAVLLLLGACAAPSYYAQAAAGQWQLSRQSRPIDDWLADETTSVETAERLELAQELLAFATRELALPATDSYSSYAETGREAVTWIVVAAPEFSLEPKTWCFLVAGCVPYRGYFDHDDAQRFADRMQGKGFDVSVSPAAAYSTLGWFDDPLVDSMFGSGEADFAGTLFHEMAHQELYLPGDALFSESYAGFMEELGVRLWLESRNRQAIFEEWLDKRAANERVNEVLEEHRLQLGALYDEGLEPHVMRRQKEAILQRLCTSLGRKPGDDCKINNATLALHRSYEGGHCAFARLFDETGRDIRRFHDESRAISRWPAERRSAWLERPCNAVAPGHEL
jgi:predicted aminopeptidase